MLIKFSFDRLQHQLASTVYFLRKVIEFTAISPQKTKDELLCLMKPFIVDFQEQSWVESVAPYADFLHNVRQKSPSETYENFDFHNFNFSITKFNRQLKSILTVLVESLVEE